ncbi:MAG: hypothetical protein GX211_07545 [Clostridiaceae bacterium]|nr:hypothetical protein [Clostridiaceae bacterium]
MTEVCQKNRPLDMIASNCISCYNEKVRKAGMFEFTERLNVWKKKY